MVELIHKSLKYDEEVPMKKNVNWFKEQENKAAAKAKTDLKPKNNAHADYKEVAAPILKLQINPKVEASHFEDSFAFAMKMSDPKSNDLMTIHMDMHLKLHFNMKQDEAFEASWKAKELMCLIAFPRNWKTMPIADLDDEDAEDYDLNDPAERFEYLYEVGMFIFEG